MHQSKAAAGVVVVASCLEFDTGLINIIPFPYLTV
jgi:hypothetical protein